MPLAVSIKTGLDSYGRSTRISVVVRISFYGNLVLHLLTYYKHGPQCIYKSLIEVLIIKGCLL